MPPKVKITKKDIIDKALELVREGGAEALNARSIARSLDCSTQPIFSNFESMEELEYSVLYAAFNKYLGFISAEIESGKYPAYKASGMAYTRFAREERELFKYLFMYTKINTDGSIEVLAPLSRAGDRIILEALVDVTLAIAACSVSESSCNSGKCSAISVNVGV